VNIDMYERALERTRNLVHNTRRDQFDDPTPCTDWDVRTLLNHLIGGCISYAVGGSGERAHPPTGSDHVGTDHVGAFEDAAKGALEAFRAPGALDRTFSLPTGDTPGSAALGLALAEAAVHGWDLATATGQPAAIDDDIAESLYQMTTSMMAPQGPYPRRTAFEDPVDVDDDASPADRLLAYLGRRP
jgi:uncharacterized protein (TIGR03086 family)